MSNEDILKGNDIFMCANCGTPTAEDDLCSCEDFCFDCHESGVSSSCVDVEEERSRDADPD